MQRCIAACLIFFMFLFLVPGSVAAAEEPAVWFGEIQGVPLWITVVHNEHINSAMSREEGLWWNWGNTVTDSYLFAFHKPEDVRMILSFDRKPNGNPVAKIYVNHLGEKTVQYSLADGMLKILSNDGHPYVTVEALDGSWKLHDNVSYNLQLDIDGPLSGIGPQDVETDGRLDVQIRIGSKQPGIPDWETYRVSNDLYPYRGYIRFVAMQRLPDSPPFVVKSPLMPTFPYLGFDILDCHSAEGRSYNNMNPNPIMFNIEQLALSLCPFTNNQSGGSYYVSSVSNPPDVDFESPYAFYNFDPSTRKAHLVIRAERYPANDIHDSDNRVIEQSTFRYSWKMENDEDWRYALGFSGFHPFEDQYQIGNEALTVVGPDQLPNWILSRSWPVTTFTEAVDGFPGAEGIYAYSAQSHDNRPWLDGVSTEPPTYLWAPYINSPDFPFESLPVGFRGEYITPNNDLPQLYFSPVDGRLHLLGAMGGVWNLGGGRILRLHNLDGDDHIDGWTREVPPQQSGDAVPSQVGSADLIELQRALPGEIEEALYAIEDYLVYSGSGRAIIAQSSYAIESLRMPPPYDKESWESFRAHPILNQRLERDPMHLVRWLDAFESREMSIQGAQITDIRHITDGFRFVLDLQPGFQSTGSNLLDLSNIEPGRYSVNYDGLFSIQPLTPPRPSVTLNTTELTQYEAGAVTLHLHNDGLTDLPVAAIEIWATPASGSAMLVMTRTLALLSQQSQDLLLSWTPPMAGEWTLMPILRASENEVWELPSTRVSVQPTEASDLLALLKASSTAAMLGFTLLGLLGLTILATFAFASQWSRRGLEQCDDPD